LLTARATISSALPDRLGDSSALLTAWATISSACLTA
jgi:hypothetical protein